MHIDKARDDAPTLIAIAVLAFIVADIAHEVIGHGAAYLAVGGRSFVMTTTRWIGQGVHADSSDRLFAGVENGDLYGKIFSLGGPLGSLLFAGLAGLALRSLRHAGIRPRLFLWLAMAFNLFWGVGYLIYSGVTGSGDWAESIRGVPPALVWRLVMLAAGLLLYSLAMKALAGEIGRFIPLDDPESRGRVGRLVWLSYWAAGVISCVAAAFDPRGADQVYKSAALVSFCSAAGLLAVPRLLRRLPFSSEVAGDPIARSIGWILAAVLTASLYVGALGPGVSVSL
jgi:hypothetical protein